MRAAVAANPQDGGAQLRLIDHLLASRRRYEALATARAALQALPGDGRLIRRVAELLAGLGRGPEALRLLQSSSARIPELQVTRARLLAWEGNRAEAVRLLQSLSRPAGVDLAGNAAQVYLDALRPDLAAEILQSHATRAGSSPELRTLYSLALLRDGRYVRAAAVLTELVNAAPQVPVLRFYLGSALRLADRARLSEAAEHLLQATTLSPEEPLYHYEQALALVQLRDLPSAQQAMERAVALRPDLSEAQRDLARIYARLEPPQPERAAATHARYLLLLEDPRAAIRELTPHHQRAPTQPDVTQALALAYHATSQTEQAVRILARLHESQPVDRQVHWELFRAQRASPHPEHALTTLESLGQLPEIDSLQVLHERADLLQRLDRYADAETLYQDLCTRDPQNPVRHFELGLFLKLWSKRPDRAAAAEQSFREALRLQPDHVGAHFRLGELLEAAGRPQEAVDHLQRAHELTPALWEALRPLARAYTRMGRRKESEVCFAAYRRHQQRDEEKRRLELVSSQGRATRASRDRLYRFLLSTGQLPEATRELERYLHFHPDDPAARRQLAQLFGFGRRFQRQFEERTSPPPASSAPR